MFYFAAIASRAACYPTSVVHFHFSDGKESLYFLWMMHENDGTCYLHPLEFVIVFKSTPIIDLVSLKILDSVADGCWTGTVGSVFTILWQTFTLYWFTCRSACLCLGNFSDGAVPYYGRDFALRSIRERAKAISWARKLSDKITSVIATLSRAGRREKRCSSARSLFTQNTRGKALWSKFRNIVISCARAFVNFCNQIIQTIWKKKNWTAEWSSTENF